MNTRNWIVIPFVAAGVELSRIFDLKRELIRKSIAAGDLEGAQETLDQFRWLLRSLRDALAAELTDDDPKRHITWGVHQEMIHGIESMDESLQAVYPDLSQYKVARRLS